MIHLGFLVVPGRAVDCEIKMGEAGEHVGEQRSRRCTVVRMLWGYAIVVLTV